MEKDPSRYQDAAKMVAGDGLSAEGTETQVRPRGGPMGGRARGGRPQG